MKLSRLVDQSKNTQAKINQPPSPVSNSVRGKVVAGPSVYGLTVTPLLSPWRFYINGDAKEIVEGINVPNTHKVYLDDLSHRKIAQATGEKKWALNSDGNPLKDTLHRDKKLTRILKEGGVVVINTDSCSPNGLLSFNPIEAFYKSGTTLKGLGPETTLSPNCRFIFVGNKPHQSDFTSRYLQWNDTYLPKDLIDKKSPLLPSIIHSDLSQAAIPGTAFNVSHTPPEEWKALLTTASITNNKFAYPHLDPIKSQIQEGNTPLHIRGVKDDISETDIPESFKKFVAKLGITKIILHHESLPKIQTNPVNADPTGTNPVIPITGDTLSQLLNATKVDKRGHLSLVNALSTHQGPLTLHVVEGLTDTQWFQLHTLCNLHSNLSLSKDTHVTAPADIHALDSTPGGGDRIQDDSQDHITLFLPDGHLQLEDLTQSNTSDASLGHFTLTRHPIIEALKKNLPVTVTVNDPQAISGPLKHLTQSPPFACINGKIRFFKTPIILKASTAHPSGSETTQSIKPHSFSILNYHQTFYQDQLRSALEINHKVKIHGGFASGKSHLAANLPKDLFGNTHHLPAISPTTSSSEILKNPEFITFVKEGGTLIIDEYNLAKEGTFDFLNGHIPIEGKFFKLDPTKHKLIFLGNEVSEAGRHAHSNIGATILPMKRPDFDLVLNDPNIPNLTEADKTALRTQNSQSPLSIRDILTYVDFKKSHTQVSPLSPEDLISTLFSPQVSQSDLPTQLTQFLITTRQSNIRGNKFLYITGEPGTGKDYSITQAIKDSNDSRPVTHITFGSHMDIKDFQKTINTAAKQGGIVVISELSAAPSAVLEFMNDVLAKQIDTPFCVIASDNAGFQGREPLSNALKSRMIRKELLSPDAQAFKKTFPHYNPQLIDFHFHLKKTRPNDLVCRQIHNAQRLMDIGITFQDAIYSVYSPIDPSVRQHLEAFLKHVTQTPVDEHLKTCKTTSDKRSPAEAPGGAEAAEAPAKTSAASEGVEKDVGRISLRRAMILFVEKIAEIVAWAMATLFVEKIAEIVAWAMAWIDSQPDLTLPTQMATRSLQKQGPRLVRQDVVMGESTHVNNGFLAMVFYDLSKNELIQNQTMSNGPIIFSKENQKIPKATLHWTAGPNKKTSASYPCGKDLQKFSYRPSFDTQPTPEKIQYSIDDLKYIYTDPISFSQALTAYFQITFRYSLDPNANNTWLDLLKSNDILSTIDTWPKEDGIPIGKCREINLLALRIIKDTFPQCPVVYAIGKKIDQKTLTSADHAQLVMKNDQGVLFTLDATPISCAKDKLTQKQTQQWAQLIPTHSSSLEDPSTSSEKPAPRKMELKKSAPQLMAQLLKIDSLPMVPTTVEGTTPDIPHLQVTGKLAYSTQKLRPCQAHQKDLEAYAAQLEYNPKTPIPNTHDHFKLLHTLANPTSYHTLTDAIKTDPIRGQKLAEVLVLDHPHIFPLIPKSIKSEMLRPIQTAIETVLEQESVKDSMDVSTQTRIARLFPYLNQSLKKNIELKINAVMKEQTMSQHHQKLIVCLLPHLNKDLQPKINAWIHTNLKNQNKQLLRVIRTIGDNNNKTIITRLITEFPLLLCTKDLFGDTLLHAAAEKGHTKIVKELIKAGTDLNATNYGGYTPLYWAAEKGHTEIAKELIKAGTDLNATSNSGSTPLHAAALKGHNEIAEALIDNGVYKNIKNKYGCMPLHVAVNQNHLEIVIALVNDKEDINDKINNNINSLHLAALKGHKEIVQELLKAKADVAATSKEGMTPLHWAASKGDKEIVQKLLEAGADVNTKNNNKMTPLDIAKRKGHQEIVAVLNGH
jgi:ankyrin repeat protein